MFEEMTLRISLRNGWGNPPKVDQRQPGESSPKGKHIITGGYLTRITPTRPLPTLSRPEGIPSENQCVNEQLTEPNPNAVRFCLIPYFLLSLDHVSQGKKEIETG